MRKNKHGAIFALYLVFLTLFMCGLAIYLYIIVNSKIPNSLVSPVKVLKLEDDYWIFEFEEDTYVKKIGCELKGKEDFETKFREKFFKEIETEGDNSMKKFLFEDLAMSGTLVLEDDKKNNMDKILGSIYSIKFSGDKLSIKRKAGKKFKLDPVKNKDNSFPVEVEFVYEKDIKLNLEECE